MSDLAERPAGGRGPRGTTVVLNGERRTLAVEPTLAAAVEASGAAAGARGLAVAVDGAVVPRREWATTTLHEGQRVEVLQAVQGG